MPKECKPHNRFLKTHDEFVAFYESRIKKKIVAQMWNKGCTAINKEQKK